MVQAQGGDVAQVDHPELLPQAQFVEEIRADHDGVVSAIDTAEIGWACVHLGGGRLVKSDQIDHAVGLVLPVKVGDRVAAGAVIGTIHANDRAKLSQAREEIVSAITISGTAVDPLPNFYGVVQ